MQIAGFGFNDQDLKSFPEDLGVVPRGKFRGKKVLVLVHLRLATRYADLPRGRQQKMSVLYLPKNCPGPVDFVPNEDFSDQVIEGEWDRLRLLQENSWSQ